jgi:HPt (histidine-containing phosphotransfer) domain-containing protein
MHGAAADATLEKTMSRFSFHRRQQATDAGGAGAAPALLDADALARLRQLDPNGSRGFVAQVLRTFEASLVRHLATLEDARLQGDLKRAGDVAHTLKSSSASVGALAFAQGCTALERLARLGDRSALGAPLQALQLEGTRVLGAVRAMLQP